MGPADRHYGRGRRALEEGETGAGDGARDAVGPRRHEGHLGVAQTLRESAKSFGRVGPTDLAVPVHEVRHARRTHPLAVGVGVLEVHHHDHVAMAQLGQVGTERAPSGGLVDGDEVASLLGGHREHHGDAAPPSRDHARMGVAGTDRQEPVDDRIGHARRVGRAVVGDGQQIDADPVVLQHVGHGGDG